MANRPRPWWTNARFAAYVGDKVGDGMGVSRWGSTSRRYLTDGTGGVLGYCALSKGWYQPSYIGTMMYQVNGHVGPVCVTGRTYGRGMLASMWPTAKQDDKAREFIMQFDNPPNLAVWLAAYRIQPRG